MGKQNTTNCANCKAELIGKFCHKCGEKRFHRSDYSLQGFVQDVFEKFTHLDSKLLTSFKGLLWPPGRMSADYLGGKRKKYVKPLSFFFVVNLLYFLTISWNFSRTYETPLRIQYLNLYGDWAQKAVAAQLADQAPDAHLRYEQRFNQQNHFLSKTLLVLMAPLLALSLALLFFRQKLYFGEQLIVALHLHSLLILQNITLGCILRGNLSILMGQRPSGYWSELAEPILWIAVLAFLTFRTVWGGHPLLLFVKAVFFALLWFVALLIYRFLVFLLTFLSIAGEF